VKPLLLDTHVWLWFALANRDRLKPDAIQSIQEAARHGWLQVSIITVWEIGLLESKGRIHLGLALDDWIKRALALPGLGLAPLDPKTALDCNRLPGEFHADPADRIIVATARRLDATLMTADRKIIEYGKSGYVSIVEP
jgi:PIN domain nuclease of toxin-antitoxin system